MFISNNLLFHIYDCRLLNCMMILIVLVQVENPKITRKNPQILFSPPKS